MSQISESHILERGVRALRHTTHEQILRWFLEDPETHMMFGLIGIKILTQVRKMKDRAELERFKSRVTENMMNLGIFIKFNDDSGTDLNEEGPNEENHNDYHNEHDDMEIDDMELDDMELDGVELDGVELDDVDFHNIDLDDDMNTNYVDGLQRLDISDTREVYTDNNNNDNNNISNNVEVINIPDNTTTPDILNENTTENKKEPQKHCAHKDCKRRLRIFDIQCKCGFKYCALHKHFANHNCDFDYKTEFKERVKKEENKVNHGSFNFSNPGNNSAF